MPTAEAIQQVTDRMMAGRELREIGSRVIAQGLEAEGGQVAFAFGRGDKKMPVEDPQPTAADPVDREDQRLSRLLLGAAVDESKSEARQVETEAVPPKFDVSKALGNPEPVIPNESPEEREWYESLRNHEVRGFSPRGSLPHTEGAAWVAVDEYWDKHIEQNDYRDINKIGHA